MNFHSFTLISCFKVIVYNFFCYVTQRIVLNVVVIVTLLKIQIVNVSYLTKHKVFLLNFVKLY